MSFARVEWIEWLGWIGWKTNVRDKSSPDGRNFLDLLSPQETYLIPRFSLDDTRKNDNKLPVKVFVWMQIVLSTGSWFVAFVPNTGDCFAAFVPRYWCLNLLCRFCAKVLVLALPLLCQSTGACFAAFVPKYWSFACCLCAKLPVPSLLPLIVVACPNYRWLCFRCMLMYRAVAWLINWRLYELWCTSTCW